MESGIELAITEQCFLTKRLADGTIFEIVELYPDRPSQVVLRVAGVAPAESYTPIPRRA